ncbi:hypothetical protein [uncultured Lactobacillus sp.]|uniref:hypothetical protein n=1 Tax=uncultured Lactobacillus sp. TaxID=153152 RepID=UPI002805B578|nr:hypothetical protein [uncultured Lactobacillus sp.]
MKKSFRYSLIAAALMAVAPIGAGIINEPATVQAAQKIYGKGSKYTVPKSLRGTWYTTSSNVKYKTVRIGAHSFNGKTVYHQNKKAIPDSIYNPSTKAQMSEQSRLMNATKNIVAGYYTKRANGKYFTFAPWIGFEQWDMFKAKTMRKNGKTIKYLDYSNGYAGAKYFKSRSLARKY